MRPGNREWMVVPFYLFNSFFPKFSYMLYVNISCTNGGLERKFSYVGIEWSIIHSEIYFCGTKCLSLFPPLAVMRLSPSIHSSGITVKWKIDRPLYALWLLRAKPLMYASLSIYLFRFSFVRLMDFVRSFSSSIHWNQFDSVRHIRSVCVCMNESLVA